MFKYFYCTICNAWKRISTSTGHIRIHYDTASHSNEKFLEKNQMTSAMACKMSKATTLFLLTNGLPFRLIDDQYFQLLPTVGHRKRLKDLSRELARVVLDNIKRILARVTYCSLSVDEWSDITRQRYIGVSCHTKLEGVMRVFTLAHYAVSSAIGPDGRDHLNAKDIATIVYGVMKDFEISAKTLLIVTDRAAVMQNAITLLTDMRLADGLTPVLWAPCVCHVVNSLLSKLVQLLSDSIQSVIEVQKRLANSEIFANKLVREDHGITRIPSYCSVRWYSLFDMFKAMKRLKDPILDFYQTEILEPVPASVWRTIEELLPLITVVKSATKALEGERYSTICFVLQAFQKIYDKVLELPKLDLRYMEAVQAWADYYQRTVVTCRKQWYPLLEVACFLHPGLTHSRFLTSGDRIEIASFLEKNHSWTDITLLPAMDRAMRERVPSPAPTTAVYHPRTGKLQEAQVPSERKEFHSDKDAFRSLMDHDTPTNSQMPRAQTIKDEISAYIAMLRVGLMPEQFWPLHTEDLPRLSTIAGRIMSIIPSSAGTERTFSVSKRIQGLHRAHMSKNVFEDQVIVCANAELAEQAFDQLDA